MNLIPVIILLTKPWFPESVERTRNMLIIWQNQMPSLTSSKEESILAGRKVELRSCLLEISTFQSSSLSLVGSCVSWIIILKSSHYLLERRRKGAQLGGITCHISLWCISSKTTWWSVPTCIEVSYLVIAICHL